MTAACACAPAQLNLGQKAERLVQLGQTSRWHTEINLKTQDVAQHSFNVAWFCWLLSDGAPSAHLLMAAIAHDAGERQTGDMPAPTKVVLGLGDLLDAMEASYLEPLGYQHYITHREKRILKFADALDGAFFCLREVMLGNRLPVIGEWNGAALKYREYLAYLIQRETDVDLSGKVSELCNHLENRYAEFGCRLGPLV